MVSESEQSEWEEIEVTDTSDMELKPEPTPPDLPAYTTPTSQPIDEVSSMECEPIPSASSPPATNTSTDLKLEPIQEQIDEAIKQELMSPNMEPIEVSQINDTNSGFGGYPIKPEVTEYVYKVAQLCLFINKYII